MECFLVAAAAGGICWGGFCYDRLDWSRQPLSGRGLTYYNAKGQVLNTDFRFAGICSLPSKSSRSFDIVTIDHPVGTNRVGSRWTFCADAAPVPACRRLQR